MDYSKYYPTEESSTDYSKYFPESLPSSPKAPERPKVEDPGVLMSMLIGAGRTTDKVLQGSQQIMDSIRSSLGDTTAAQRLEANKKAQEENDAIYSRLKGIHPLTTGFGESVPYMALPASGAGVIPSALGMGILGGIQYGSPRERAGQALTDTAVGGVSAALPRAIKSVISPNVNEQVMGAQANIQRNLELARRIEEKTNSPGGMRIRLDERTGSKGLGQLADTVAQVPGGAGIMAENYQQRLSTLNKLAARSIGESADNLSPEVLSSANERLGKVFQAVRDSGYVINVDPRLKGAAQNILNLKRDTIFADAPDPVVDKVYAAARSVLNARSIDTKQYGLWRSEVSNLLNKAEGEARIHLGNLLTSLDDAAQNTLTQVGDRKLAENIKVARSQWKNLKLLESGQVIKDNNVAPDILLGKLASQESKALREGTNNPWLQDLIDVAQSEKAFPRLKTGSQTYPRMFMSGLASIASGSAGAGAGGMVGGVPGASIGGAAGLALPFVGSDLIARGLHLTPPNIGYGAYRGLLARNPAASRFADLAGYGAGLPAGAMTRGMLFNLINGTEEQ